MKIELYCDRTAILKGLPCNARIDEVLARIEELRSQGVDLKVVDTARMSEQEIQADYMRAIQPSVRKKYSVRQTFGSLNRPAWLFGRAVPALVVQEPSGEIADVFPHNESGKIVTIHDALNAANSAFKLR